jgi:ABC-2 type transport system permease protein
MTAATTTLPVASTRKPSSATYVKYELLRAFRNKRFMIFSLAFPLVLFYLVAAPNRNAKLGGINFAVYYMTGMLAYGSMAAVLSGGARITQERSVNWHRQIRITPLSTRTYFATKILSGYAVASLSIILLFAAGTSVGVRLSAPHWLELTGYILVALIPFAVIGIVLGHLLTVDSMGPAMGGITALFSLLGGAWGPLASHGWLQSVVQWLPSYWLVQAGKTAVGGGAWPVKAWIVIAAWTAGMARIAVWVYKRDTDRV